MIACLRVLCGSSVYVQKKSCSCTSSGGFVAVSSGEVRSLAVLAEASGREVVMVDVE